MGGWRVTLLTGSPARLTGVWGNARHLIQISERRVNIDMSITILCHSDASRPTLTTGPREETGED